MSLNESAVPTRRPILLIGSLGADAPAIRQALDELGLDHQEMRAVAVSETLSHLREATAEGPRIILLALEGPTRDDLSLLKSIKGDEQLRSLPVVVLGPSGNTSLVDESFGLGAAGYMARAAAPREWTAAVRAVRQYWSLSELPR